MENNFFQPEAHFELDDEVSLEQKSKFASTPSIVSEDEISYFECNICLDSAHDPVVTHCGHLYCGPCIYKWLRVQGSSDEPADQQNCPVCKASISHASLVPLYGRGTSNSGSKPERRCLDLVVPRRPSSAPSSAGLNLNPLITSATTSTSHPSRQFNPNYFESRSQSFHQQYLPHSYAANSPSSYLGGSIMTSLFNPTIGMFGDMVFPRMLGSSARNSLSYPRVNSYTTTGISSPRIRRQEMQLDKSLNRVSIFFFCCLILCLLLF